MRSWNSLVRSVVLATARSTCASPRIRRRTAMPAARTSSSPIVSSLTSGAGQARPSCRRPSHHQYPTHQTNERLFKVCRKVHYRTSADSSSTSRGKRAVCGSRSGTMLARQFVLSGMLALVCTLAWVPPARSQSYPTRQITLVVPATPGGSNDTIARIVAEHMGKTLGQSIVIENIGGAGGTTAARRVAQAAPDGYTIMAGNMGTHGAAPAQYSDLRYDPIKDFTPIGQIAGAPAVIIVRKDFPASNLKEFVSYVKENEAKVNEAHAGVGSQMHTFCTYLHSLMGTKTARIAYRGGGPVVTDLMSGNADFGCISLNSVVGQIQAGAIKAIAVASRERAEVIKDVPTAAEGGLPDYQVSSWNALFAPRDLPPDIRARLNDALVRALDDADTRKRLLEIGTVIPANAERTPQALQALVG